MLPKSHISFLLFYHSIPITPHNLHTPLEFHRGVSSQFAPSHSSPMAPPGKVSKQTSIDSFSRPGTRCTTKDVAGKEPGAEKLDKKQKETDHQEQSGGSAADHQEVVGPSRGKGTEPGVISTEEGRVFLEEEGFIDHTEQVDANALAGVLVQVTLMDGMALKARHAVRAVALMLGQLKSEDIGDAILTRVETKLDAMLGKVAEKQAAASVEAANAVGSVLEKSVEEIKLVARGMQDNTARLTKSATKYSDVLQRAAPPPSQANTRASSHLPPCLQAREGVKARQVLINFKQDQGPAPFGAESLVSLKTRLDKALNESEDGQGIHKIRALTRLRNGRILMELGSDEAVRWFDDEVVRGRFLGNIHPGAFIKPRVFNIVVQFVPLMFRPEKDMDLRELEQVNGLEDRAVTKVRWIKPAARQTPSQTCGHMILSFSSPVPANDTLAYGLFICQKKVYTEKCKKEPLQCLKFHLWGHVAANCLAAHDTCGTCAHHHRTANCTNLDSPRCVSCGITGHASWARDCPVFQWKCQELGDRLEDNSLPYFPMLEAWPQVKEPPRIVFAAQPPHLLAMPGRANSGYRQTTLSWANRGAPRPTNPRQNPRSGTGYQSDNRDAPPHAHPSNE